MNILEGYKTYAICILALITLVLFHYGVITGANTDGIMTVLGIGGVAAIRSAISKNK